MIPLREALRLVKVSFRILFKSYHNKEKKNTDNLVSLGYVALNEPHRQHTVQTLSLQGLSHFHHCYMWKMSLFITTAINQKGYSREKFVMCF